VLEDGGCSNKEPSPLVAPPRKLLNMFWSSLPSAKWGIGAVGLSRGEGPSCAELLVPLGDVLRVCEGIGRELWERGEVLKRLVEGDPMWEGRGGLTGCETEPKLESGGVKLMCWEAGGVTPLWEKDGVELVGYAGRVAPSSCMRGGPVFCEGVL
jgi:hypothetical protein